MKHSVGFKLRNVILLVCLNDTKNYYSIQKFVLFGLYRYIWWDYFSGWMNSVYYITTVSGEVFRQFSLLSYKIQ